MESEEQVPHQAFSPVRNDKEILKTGSLHEEDWNFVWDGKYVSAGAGGEDQLDAGRGRRGGVCEGRRDPDGRTAEVCRDHRPDFAGHSVLPRVLEERRAAR